MRTPALSFANIYNYLFDTKKRRRQTEERERERTQRERGETTCHRESRWQVTRRWLLEPWATALSTFALYERSIIQRTPMSALATLTLMAPTWPAVQPPAGAGR